MFWPHNLTALLAYDRRFRNDSVYQKTFGANDFYFDDGTTGGPPLGHVQLFGRVSPQIMKGTLEMGTGMGARSVVETFRRHPADERGSAQSA